MKSPEVLCRATLEELGRRVLVARNEIGMTQSEADSRLEVSGGYMSTLETNRKNSIPTVEAMLRVAKLLRVDADDLVVLVLRARLLRALAKTQGRFSGEQAARAARTVAGEL